MFSNNYKGFIIHGYFHKPSCIVSPANGGNIGTFNSYRAAQLAITQLLKSNQNTCIA